MSRVEGDADALLLDAAPLLATASLPTDDRACFEARLADQRAFQLNRRGEHEAALAVYRALPAEDTHPFASYRRDAGLAHGLHRTGHPDEALARALSACRHAGDGGYTRLRAMGLLLVARLRGPGAPELDRAGAIAERLHDGELAVRVQRLRGR